MGITFTAHKDAAVDYDGTEIREYNSTFESPFVPSIFGAGTNGHCYVIYRGFFGTYKIKECIVYSICYTNMWGWRMNNDWCFTEKDLGKTVFKYDELKKAIEVCEEKNRMRKVKVKYL